MPLAGVPDRTLLFMCLAWEEATTRASGPGSTWLLLVASPEKQRRR